MTLSLEHDCPECGDPWGFYCAASTGMYLGTKEKWHCPECDYGFVVVGDIDTPAASA